MCTATKMQLIEYSNDLLTINWALIILYCFSDF